MKSRKTKTPPCTQKEGVRSGRCLVKGIFGRVQSHPELVGSNLIDKIISYNGNLRCVYWNASRVRLNGPRGAGHIPIGLGCFQTAIGEFASGPA